MGKDAKEVGENIIGSTGRAFKTLDDLTGGNVQRNILDPLNETDLLGTRAAKNMREIAEREEKQTQELIAKEQKMVEERDRQAQEDLQMAQQRLLKALTPKRDLLFATEKGVQ